MRCTGLSGAHLQVRSSTSRLLTWHERFLWLTISSIQWYISFSLVASTWKLVLVCFREFDLNMGSVRFASTGAVFMRQSPGHSVGILIWIFPISDQVSHKSMAHPRGGAAALQPPPNHPKLKTKKHRFCTCYRIRSFTCFFFHSAEISWWPVHKNFER
jgi:hypothetical protein